MPSPSRRLSPGTLSAERGRPELEILTRLDVWPFIHLGTAGTVALPRHWPRTEGAGRLPSRSQLAALIDWHMDVGRARGIGRVRTSSCIGACVRAEQIQPRFRRFQRQGRATVRSEWRLQAALQNLLKLVWPSEKPVQKLVCQLIARITDARDSPRRDITGT